MLKCAPESTCSPAPEPQDDLRCAVAAALHIAGQVVAGVAGGAQVDDLDVTPVQGSVFAWWDTLVRGQGAGPAAWVPTQAPAPSGPEVTMMTAAAMMTLLAGDGNGGGAAPLGAHTPLLAAPSTHAPAVALDEDVLWLEVTVDEAQAVDEGQRAQHLQEGAWWWCMKWLV